MQGFESKAADSVLPPCLSGTGYASLVTGNSVTQISVTNSAGETALPLGAGKKAYISVQNVSGGSSAFIAFKLDAGAASITTTTGWEIPAGTTAHFVLDKDIVDTIEHITSSGTATLKLYVSSRAE